LVFADVFNALPQVISVRLGKMDSNVPETVSVHLEGVSVLKVGQVRIVVKLIKINYQLLKLRQTAPLMIIVEGYYQFQTLNWTRSNIKVVSQSKFQDRVGSR
jgi:hypothetical protein